MSLNPIPGAEHIRAIDDEDAKFTAFDAYPWKKDRIFMDGLSAILGSPDDGSAGIPSQMATHARLFYYAQRIGVKIDFNNYADWLARHPEHTVPDILPPEFLAAEQNGTGRSPAVQTLAWQAAAPKADLYINKSSDQMDGSMAAAEPSYPAKFAEMLALLERGEPIPGIRQIPDTVIRDPAVKPFGTRALPKKPWERNAPSSEIAASTTNGEASNVDIDFPPIAVERGSNST